MHGADFGKGRVREIVSPDVQRYVNLTLVKYVEEDCKFIVIEGIHRLIVSFCKCNISLGIGDRKT